MSSSPIDTYLADVEEPHLSALQNLREVITSIMPGAKEVMSYGMPGFALEDGVVAGFAAYKNFCSYYPHSGSIIPLFAEVLEPYIQSESKGGFQFDPKKPLKKSLVKQLLLARLAQIEEKANAKPGISVAYYSNGYVKHRGKMRGSAMHGPWKWFRTDGTLMRSGEFKNDVQVGEWCTWDRDGNLVKRTTFKP